MANLKFNLPPIANSCTPSSEKGSLVGTNNTLSETKIENLTEADVCFRKSRFRKLHLGALCLVGPDYYR